MRLVSLFIYLVWILGLVPAVLWADPCLNALLPGSKQGCLVACETYYQAHPEARPKALNQICQNSFENLAQAVNPLLSFQLAMQCFDGGIDGVAILPEQLALYSKYMRKIKKDFEGQKARVDELLNRIDQDPKLKKELAKEIYQYRHNTAETQLEEVVRSHSAREIWDVAQSSKQELANACLKMLVNIEGLSKQGAQGHSSKVSTAKNQRHQKEKPSASSEGLYRYQELIRQNPDCPWALEISAEDLNPSLQSKAETGWLSQLGVQIQCYPPEVKTKLLCFELVKTLADPLNLTLIGGLAAKTLATAGIKAVAERVALRSDLKKISVPTLEILGANLQASRRALNYDLTALEREKINKAYATLGPGKKSLGPQVNYEMQVTKLLERLPQAERQEVQRILDSRYKLSARGSIRDLWTKFQGSYDVKKKKIEIVVPKSLQGTDLEYMVKMHETIHLVNAISVSARVGEPTKKAMAKLMDSVKYQYFDEAAAMAQEWKYIEAIPSDVKSKLIQEIEANKRMDAADKETLIHSFSAEAKTPSGYVLGQHEVGRYSKDMLIGHSKSEKENEILIRANVVMGGFIYGAAECFARSAENDTRSLFYKYVCTKHPLIKDVIGSAEP